MDQFLSAITELLKHPPDPNETTPLANRYQTVYGVTIPFLVLSWVAVGFRLHTRFRIVRDPGLDDAFVTLAAVLNSAGHIAFYGGYHKGIGQHIIFIIDRLQTTMIWFYAAKASYTMTTACIKISLLLQYLRLFREGYVRTITTVLLVIVILWGGAFSFMAVFPCFPVSGFWNKTMVPAAKCYGFGYRTVEEVTNTLLAFSGTNMGLDIVILLLPLTECFRTGLKRRQILAMTGLFGLGAIVVMMAVLRLWSGLKHRNSLVMYDFTWWWPEVLIFSCLEVDFAIMCASVPIFWPTVTAAWTEIFVTREVTVTHARRSIHPDHNVHSLELDRMPSLRSHDSTEGLTKSQSGEGTLVFKDFNSESGPGSGITRVEVQTSTQKVRIL